MTMTNEFQMSKFKCQMNVKFQFQKRSMMPPLKKGGGGGFDIWALDLI